jgi:hypothetical protein
MNNRPGPNPNPPNPSPPQRQTVTISDILQIRLALDQIANPSDAILKARSDLDIHIVLFTSSLSSGEPSNG